MASPDPRKALADWLDAERGRAVKVADALGRTPAGVSAWKRGDVPVPPEFRKPLERLTGGAVPAEWWDTDEDRAQRDRLRRVRPLATGVG